MSKTKQLTPVDSLLGAQYLRGIIELVVQESV